MAASGKSVLLVDDKRVTTSVYSFDTVSSMGLTNNFRLTTPLANLADETHFLEIAATQDPASAEYLSIPLVVLAHPPALSLHVVCAGCFLLPDLDNQTRRTEYALCEGGGSDVDEAAMTDVTASVHDARFKVHTMVLPESESCMGHGMKEMRKEFSAVRNDSCSWCNRNYQIYPAWAEGYDVAVIHSVSTCLRLALQLRNASLLKEIVQRTVTSQSPKIYQYFAKFVSAG